MRKILFLVLLALVGILLFMAMVTEFPLKEVPVSTLKEIQDASVELDKKLDDLSKLTGSTYPSKKDKDLKAAVRELELEKQAFDEKSQYSSVDDIALASTQEKYKADFLWVELGKYASNEGIDASLTFVKSSTGIDGLYDIKFVLDGAYLSITDFIYTIENDQKMNFRVQNFALVPGGGAAASDAQVANVEPTNVENQDTSGETATGETVAPTQTTAAPTKGTDTNTLQATFTVKDVIVSFD